MKGMQRPLTNHIRLSELNGRINAVLNEAFSTITFWVIADITNHTFRAQKNYHNFELVEKDPHSSNIIARISGKAWGAGSDSITNFERITGQRFTNNINVLLHVAVQYHPVYGLQVNILDIDPNFTLGMLEQQRQATLERLVLENQPFINRVGDRYITKNNQLPLPAVIQKIAVISSKTSAGNEDFAHTLLNNPYQYQFTLDYYFTVVQGESNARQFFDKLLEVFNSKVTYDAVVIIRGGGAQTDFLIFDNYDIGRAIARFPIPIITGIGHQKNETIADLMAHTPTKTPTKAAEFILAHNRTFEDALLSFQQNIIIRSQQIFSFHFQNLSTIQQDTIIAAKTILFNHQNTLNNISAQIISSPRIILYNRLNDIQNIVSNIKTFKTLYLRNQSGYLGHYTSLIKMMSPDNILKKGFAILKTNNRITSDPDDLKVGEDVEIILMDTQITSTVKQKTTYDGKDFNI